MSRARARRACVRGPALTCCLRGVQGLALVGGPRAVRRRVSRRQAAQPGETRRTLGRGAAPHPASPARSGGRPAVPTPRATPPRTLGRQPRPLPLGGGGGGGGTHSLLGVETKTKPRTRCAHTCARTRRVLNQAVAGLTGLTEQQRRRRQKERASEPEAPGRVAGGGGERRRGVWTRRGPRRPGPHDVLRSVASTWHQPVGNWRRALF